jgi:hypothetical protein
MKTRNVEIKNRQGFTQVSNTMLSDPNISYKAKGILCHLLSHDQDKFTITSETLIRHSSDGERSIKSGLDELKKNGYLQITREAGDKGRWKYILNMFGNKFTDTHKTTESAKTDQSVLGVCNNKNTNLKNNKKEKKSEEEKASEQSQAIIITRETELTGNTLGIGSYSNSKIKENIYKYLHSRGIQVVPGTDESQIEKHKYSLEFIYKIQRLEKLHYLKAHWREWENWIDRTQLPIFQKLELQAGSISWALSNHSTDVDAPYNLIESFIRRREREERHKIAERERHNQENDAYYKSLADKTDAPKEEKNLSQKFAESSKLEHVQNRPVAIQGLDEEKKARLAELMDKARSGLTEQENLEYRLLIDERRRSMENIL